LPVRQAPGHEMEVPRKLPILLRPGSSYRHRATVLCLDRNARQGVVDAMSKK